METEDETALEINYEDSAQYVSEKIANGTFFGVFDTLDKVLSSLKFAELSPKEAVYILRESKEIYPIQDIKLIFSHLVIKFNEDYDQCIEFLHNSYDVLKMRPMESLIDIITRSRNENIGKDAVLKMLQDEISSQKNKIPQLTKDNSNKMKAIENDKAKLNDRIRTLNAEINMKKNGNTILNNQIQNINDEIRNLNNEIQHLKWDNNHCRQKLEKLSKHENNLYMLWENITNETSNAIRNFKQNIFELVEPNNHILLCLMFGLFICGCIKGYLGLMTHEFCKDDYSFTLGIAYGYFVFLFFFSQPTKILILTSLVNIVNLIFINTNRRFMLVIEGYLLGIYSSIIERIILRNYEKKFALGVFFQVFGQYLISAIYYTTSHIQACAAVIIIASIIFCLMIYNQDIPQVPIHFKFDKKRLNIFILMVFMAYSGTGQYSFHYIYDSHNIKYCSVYLLTSWISSFIVLYRKYKHQADLSLIYLFICILCNIYASCNNPLTGRYFLGLGFGRNYIMKTLIGNQQDCFIEQCIYWIITYKRFSFIDSTPIGGNYQLYYRAEIHIFAMLFAWGMNWHYIIAILILCIYNVTISIICYGLNELQWENNQILPIALLLDSRIYNFFKMLIF